MMTVDVPAFLLHLAASFACVWLLDPAVPNRIPKDDMRRPFLWRHCHPSFPAGIDGRLASWGFLIPAVPLPNLRIALKPFGIICAILIGILQPVLFNSGFVALFAARIDAPVKFGDVTGCAAYFAGMCHGPS
jgi:hypothetical protein